MITLYHSSPSPFAEVKAYGNTTGYVDFGGIFALSNPAGSNDHGPFLHRIDLNESEVLTQYAMDTEISSDFIESILRSKLRIESDEDLELARQITELDRSLCHLTEAEQERLCYVFRSESDGLGWEGQRVRGQIALGAGYKAVEMSDEHGRSYLVLPGVQVVLVDELQEVPVTPTPGSFTQLIVPTGGRRQRRSAANGSSASDSFLASLDLTVASESVATEGLQR